MCTLKQLINLIIGNFSKQIFILLIVSSCRSFSSSNCQSPNQAHCNHHISQSQRLDPLLMLLCNWLVLYNFVNVGIHYFVPQLRRCQDHEGLEEIEGVGWHSFGQLQSAIRFVCIHMVVGVSLSSKEERGQTKFSSEFHAHASITLFSSASFRQISPQCIADSRISNTQKAPIPNNSMQLTLKRLVQRSQPRNQPKHSNPRMYPRLISQQLKNSVLLLSYTNLFEQQCTQSAQRKQFLFLGQVMISISVPTCLWWRQMCIQGYTVNCVMASCNLPITLMMLQGQCKQS